MPHLGPHPLVLATPRLSLHPVLPRDTLAMHEVWTDPDVRRFLWDGEVIPLRDRGRRDPRQCRRFRDPAFRTVVDPHPRR